MALAWGDSGATFQFVIDVLQNDWHVVAPDWRGFGRSVVKCSSYWFPDYLADLHVLLDVYSPGEPARIVGHSMGANVAGLYAGTMPERVRAFVNIEGFGLEDSDSDVRHKLPNPVLYRRAEAEACWRAITADVLLVSGGASTFALGSGLEETSVWPGATAVEIPGAGHMLHFEKPAELAAAIETFLGKYL